MYEAMDVLHVHVAEVEEAVFFSVADLMNLTVDLVFYATTTCSFALDEPDGDGGLRQFGHSKDGAWAPCRARRFLAPSFRARRACRCCPATPPT
jgi:hypothetical protein